LSHGRTPGGPPEAPPDQDCRQLGLIISPFAGFVALLKILAPVDNPVGDIRNSLEFRLFFYGLLVALAAAFFIASIRWLRADRRG